MSTPGFQLSFLPSELLLAVVEYLGPQNIPRLRLVCTRLSDLLGPLTFQNLKINQSPESIRGCLFKLQSLVDDTCPGRVWIRELRLATFHPQYTSISPTHPTSVPQEHENTYPTLEDYERLVQETFHLLPGAISSLISLERVKWRFKGRANERLLNDVVDALASLPDLRSLTLTTHRNHHQPPIHRLRYLEQASLLIILPFVHVDTLCYLSPQIRPLLNNSPGIKNLRIRYLMPPFETRCLNDLLPINPPNRLAIQNLQLDGLPCGLKIVSPIGPSLANLKSLTIRYDVGSEAASPSLLLGITQSWQQWNQHSVGIFLEELEINHVPPPALIEYLSSYSGLRQLRIYNIQRFTPAHIDSSVFWDEVLQKHSGTLEVLDIDDDKGALMYHGSSGLSTLVALRSLKLRFPVPFYMGRESLANRMSWPLAQVLKYSLTHLFRLDTLVVGAMDGSHSTTSDVPASADRTWLLKQLEAIVQQSVRTPSPRCLNSYRVEATLSCVDLECSFGNLAAENGLEQQPMEKD